MLTGECAVAAPSVIVNGCPDETRHRTARWGSDATAFHTRSSNSVLAMAVSLKMWGGTD
jgi:hypothetical protein